MTTKTIRPEIEEAFAFAALPLEVSRWGYAQTRDNGRIVRVTEDDGVYWITVLTDDRAELELSQVRVSGRLASPVGLAALLELALDES